jgi:hypothetical protein
MQAGSRPSTTIPVLVATSRAIIQAHFDIPLKAEEFNW